MYLNYRELDADIIIIGAGITGLSAAYHLLEKDPHADLLILDVDKLDFTSKQPYSSFRNMSKAGAKKKIEFADDRNKTDFQFMRVEQTHLVNLLEKLDIRMIPIQSYEEKILIDYDELHTFSQRENILEIFTFEEKTILKSFCNEVDKLSTSCSFSNFNAPPELDNISMDALLNMLISSKKVCDVVSQTFLFHTGLQPEDISASFFIAYCSSNQGIQSLFIWNENNLNNFCIEGGAENIRYKIVEVIDQYIQKVSDITEISWDDYRAGIKTPKEYFFANKILFTLNENEINNINFVPPLPDEKKTIADNSVRGNLKKFIVYYSEPFWMKRGLSGEVYVMNIDKRNGPIHICLNVSKLLDNNSHVLTGLAEKCSDKGEILNQLFIYFGEDALSPVNYEEIPSSFNDLNIHCGFKSMKYFGNICDDTDRVAWASPESANVWYGTTAGSIGVGLKGAIRVLQEIKPNTLSLNDMDSTGFDEAHSVPRTAGIKWHIVTPALILLFYAIIKFRRYLSKKQV